MIYNENGIIVEAQFQTIKKANKLVKIMNEIKKKTDLNAPAEYYIDWMDKLLKYLSYALGGVGALSVFNPTSVSTLQGIVNNTLLSNDIKKDIVKLPKKDIIILSGSIAIFILSTIISRKMAKKYYDTIAKKSRLMIDSLKEYKESLENDKEKDDIDEIILKIESKLS